MLVFQTPECKILDQRTRFWHVCHRPNQVFAIVCLVLGQRHSISHERPHARAAYHNQSHCVTTLLPLTPRVSFAHPNVWSVSCPRRRFHSQQTFFSSHNTAFDTWKTPSLLVHPCRRRSASRFSHCHLCRFHTIISLRQSFQSPRLHHLAHHIGSRYKMVHSARTRPGEPMPSLIGNGRPGSACSPCTISCQKASQHVHSLRFSRDVLLDQSIAPARLILAFAPCGAFRLKESMQLISNTANATAFTLQAASTSLATLVSLSVKPSFQRWKKETPIKP